MDPNENTFFPKVHCDICARNLWQEQTEKDQLSSSKRQSGYGALYFMQVS